MTLRLHQERPKETVMTLLQIIPIFYLLLCAKFHPLISWSIPLKFYFGSSTKSSASKLQFSHYSLNRQEENNLNFSILELLTSITIFWFEKRENRKFKNDESELEHDLLVEIVKCIINIDDFIRFGTICKSWNCAVKEENFDSSSPQAPLLLMAADKDDDYPLFYSVINHKIFAKIYIPQARGSVCLSTKQPRWLFTVQFTTTGDMTLLHLFSRTQIHLPSYHILRGIEDGDDQWKPEHFVIIQSVVLSANPSLTFDYIFMISHYAPDWLLSFWQPGDLFWTSVYIENLYGYVDFQYFNENFYILSRCRGLWVVDDLEQGHRNNPQPFVQACLVVRINRDILGSWDLLHLVQVPGALLFVAEKEETARATGVYKAYHFQVWELDVMTSDAKQIKMLGDKAIFWEKMHPYPLNLYMFPGVKPNHIYFIDGWDVIFRLQGLGGIDMRTYSLEDGEIQSSYHGVSVNPISPSTWVILSF